MTVTKIASVVATAAVAIATVLIVLAVAAALIDVAVIAGVAFLIVAGTRKLVAKAGH